METQSEDRTTRSISGHPLYVVIGDESDNPPETPPQRREEAKVALELLLSGWENAALEAEHITPYHRQIVVKTVERARAALEHHTTPHNLMATLLAEAFLQPGEIPVGTLTTGTLEALGIGFAAIDDGFSLYPTVFDRVTPDTVQPALFAAPGVPE
jgi:hypothetical protein